MSPLSLLLGAAMALAQTAGPDRPAVPSASVAAEGGPALQWVNPASMAFDPDPRWGALVAWDGAATAITATGGARGLSGGVHAITEDGTTHWALAAGTGLRLPERVAIGLNASWHLVPEGRNFVAWDAGVAWRPIPWLGVGAVAWNIGEPDPTGQVAAGSAAGVALRPLGRFATLGVDYVYSPDDPEPAVIRATTRVRPVEGLFVRASADTSGGVGLGLEVYFDGYGGGLHLDGEPTDMGQLTSVWLGTDEPGETFIRSGRRVPVLTLGQAPPYQAHAPLPLVGGQEVTTWIQVLELLDQVEGDARARGVVLNLGSLRLPWARWQELRQRIASLEGADRPVLVYLRNPSDGAYFTATAASRVVLHPAGTLDLRGVSAQLVHLRGALDLVGVEPQFVRRSEYKSAVEQYTSYEPSPEALEQMGALLDDLDAALVQGLAEGRERDAEEVRAWIDGGPWTAAEALGAGMVDALAYPDEVQGILEKLHRGPVRGLPLEEERRSRSPWEAPQQIGLVYVDGVIVDGRSSSGLLGRRTAGSATVVAALHEARDDSKIRAVVMRVDSPGGSAFASDEIWRAVKELEDQGVPVVVSMGGVAASGGYYVASAASSVWAEPTTITGSIGVYAGKFAVEGLLDKVGIGTTTLARGRHAALDDPGPWDASERARMEALVDESYRLFTARVAEGRDLEPEAVEAAARGRVWSGTRAVELGLVDHLGGLTEAMEDARRLAGIKDHAEVEIAVLNPSTSRLDQLRAAPLAALLGAAADPETDMQHLVEAYNPLLVWALRGDRTPWAMTPWSLEAP